VFKAAKYETALCDKCSLPHSVPTGYCQNSFCKLAKAVPNLRRRARYEGLGDGTVWALAHTYCSSSPAVHAKTVKFWKDHKYPGDAPTAPVKQEIDGVQGYLADSYYNIKAECYKFEHETYNREKDIRLTKQMLIKQQEFGKFILGFQPGVRSGVLCKGEKSCSFVPLSKDVDIDMVCAGSSSCYGTKLHAKTNVQCQGFKSCTKVSWPIQGGGVFSCNNSSCESAELECLDKPCIASCSGKQACKRVKLIGQGWNLKGAEAICEGDDACMESSLRRVTKCEGAGACYGAKILDLAGPCNGTKACAQSTIANTGPNHACVGSMACKEATMSCKSKLCSLQCAGGIGYEYPEDYQVDLKGKPTSMYKPINVHHGAQRAVDGSNHEARSHRVNNPWWQVDMQKDFPVGEVKFINTNHHHHYHYGPRAAWSTVSIDGQPCGKIVTKSKYHVSDCGGKTGKVIKVTVNARRRGTHLFLQKVTVQPMKRLETCAGARMTGFMKIDCLGTSSCTSVPKCTVENIKGTGGKKDTYTWSKCDGQGMFIAKSDADKPIQLTCAGARSCSNNNNLLSGGLLAMGWEAHNLAPTIKCSGVHSCSDAIPGAFALKGAVPSVEEALKKKMIQDKWKASSRLQLVFALKEPNARFMCIGKKSCHRLRLNQKGNMLTCIGAGSCSHMKGTKDWKINCDGDDTCQHMHMVIAGGGKFNCGGFSKLGFLAVTSHNYNGWLPETDFSWRGKCRSSTLECVDKACATSCAGHNYACEQANFIGDGWKKTGASVKCGTYGCRYAQLAHVTKCEGHQSCLGAKIGKVYEGCVGHMACKHAVVADAGTSFKCVGKEACMDSNLSCKSGECSVTCDDQKVNEFIIRSPYKAVNIHPVISAITMDPRNRRHRLAHKDWVAPKFQCLKASFHQSTTSLRFESCYDWLPLRTKYHPHEVNDVVPGNERRDMSWTYDSNTGQIQHRRQDWIQTGSGNPDPLGDMCLHTGQGNITGGKVGMAPCDKDDAGQRWFINGTSKEIKSHGGKCLYVPCPSCPGWFSKSGQIHGANYSQFDVTSYVPASGRDLRRVYRGGWPNSHHKSTHLPSIEKISVSPYNGWGTYKIPDSFDVHMHDCNVPGSDKSGSTQVFNWVKPTYYRQRHGVLMRRYQNSKNLKLDDQQGLENRACSGAKFVGFSNIECKGLLSCNSRSHKGYVDPALGRFTTPWITHQRSAGKDVGCHINMTKNILKEYEYKWQDCDRKKYDWSFRANGTDKHPIRISCAGSLSCSNDEPEDEKFQLPCSNSYGSNRRRRGKFEKTVCKEDQFGHNYNYPRKKDRITLGWVASPIAENTTCSGMESCRANQPAISQSPKVYNIDNKHGKKNMNGCKVPSQRCIQDNYRHYGHAHYGCWVKKGEAETRKQCDEDVVAWNKKLTYLKTREQNRGGSSFGFNDLKLSRVTCSGESACKFGSKVSKLHLNCDGKYACNDMTFKGTWKVKCPGVKSCQHVVWPISGGGTFDCAERSSSDQKLGPTARAEFHESEDGGKCRKAKLICEDKACQLKCYGEQACEGVVLSGAGWNETKAHTECQGFTACRFGDFKSVSKCSGYQACYGAKIKQLQGPCYGTQACKEAVVLDTSQHLECRGFQACMDSRINCASGIGKISCSDIGYGSKTAQYIRYGKDKVPFYLTTTKRGELQPGITMVSLASTWDYSETTGMISQPTGMLMLRNSRNCVVRDDPKSSSTPFKLSIGLDCDMHDAHVQWKYDAKTGTVKSIHTKSRSHTMRGSHSSGHYCLDTGSSKKNGDTILLKHCAEKALDQQWDFEKSTGFLKSRNTKKCIDATNQKLTVWDCDKTREAGQAWRVGDRQCMSSFDLDKLRVKPCNSSDTKQSWSYKADVIKKIFELKAKK